MKKSKIFYNLIILSILLLNFAAPKSLAEDYFYDSDFNVSNIYDMSNIQNLIEKNQNAQENENKTPRINDFSALEAKMEENYNALQKRLDETQAKKAQNAASAQNIPNAQNYKTQNAAVQNSALENPYNSNLQNTMTPKTQNYQEKSAKNPNSLQNSKSNKIKDFFSSLSFKKDDQKEKRGYYGELPDISRYYKYKQNSNPTPKNKDYKIPTLEELNNEINTEKLKLAPVDDPLFLDNILKRENTDSEYLKDIQKTKFALNNLKKCIEEQGDIQKFNAIVNVIDLTVNNFEQKYKNTPDALKESYRDIINVNYYSKLLGNLLYDANYYSKYIPTQEGKYSANNIQSEKEKLLIKLNRTIFLINQES